MRVFFDCEFTTFDAAERQLISAGFVSEDGRTSLYLELCDWRPEACSPFTVATVLPLLELAADSRVSRRAFAARLVDWLDAFGEPVTLATDYAGDWWLVAAALDEFARRGGKATRHALSTALVSSNGAAGVAATRQFWAQHPGRQHHALVDAHCLRHAVLAAEAEMAARWRAKDD